MAEANTFETVMERVALALAPSPDFSAVLTATGGDATSFIDTVNSFSTGDDSVFDGNWWMYVTSDNGGSNAAPQGELARIASFDYSAGDWTLGSTLTASIGAGDKVALLPVHPLEVLEACNVINRNTMLPRYGVLSLSSDPNMDDSGVTGYTQSGSGTAPTKSSSQGVVYSGTQSLLITGGTAGDGVTAVGLMEAGNTIDADESTQFLVSVIFRIGLGEWKFALNDSNGNEIKSVSVTQVEGATRWLEVRFNESMQSGDIGMKVAITAVTSSGTDSIAIDSVSILSPGYPLMVVPPQVKDADHIDGIFRLPQGQTTSVSDVYLPFGREFEQVYQGNMLRDYQAVHSHRVSARVGNDPLWIKYRAGEPVDLAFSTSSTETTTDVPLEIMVEGTLGELWKKRSERTRSRSLKADYRLKFLHHTTVYQELLKARGLARPRTKSSAPRHLMVPIN